MLISAGTILVDERIIQEATTTVSNFQDPRRFS